MLIELLDRSISTPVRGSCTLTYFKALTSSYVLIFLVYWMIEDVGKDLEVSEGVGGG